MHVGLCLGHQLAFTPEGIEDLGAYLKKKKSPEAFCGFFGLCLALQHASFPCIYFILLNRISKRWAGNFSDVKEHINKYHILPL